LGGLSLKDSFPDDIIVEKVVAYIIDWGTGTGAITTKRAKRNGKPFLPL